MRILHFQNATLLKTVWPQFVWLSLLILSSTVVEAQSESPQFTETRLAAEAAMMSSDEAEYYEEIYCLFSIADPQYLKKTLSKAPDLGRFQSYVNDWIRGHTARYTELKSRLAYCRKLRAAGALATPLVSPQRDIRWDLFLVNGPPTQVRVLPIKDRQNASCSVWTYTWLPSDSAQAPHEISCSSESGEFYPSAMIAPDRDGFLSAHIIEPLVHCAHFPSREERGELWFSIWVRGNELSRPTLDLARLSVSVELYDEHRSKLFAAKTSICNLQLLRGVLEASDRSSRQYIRAMEYVVFPEIASGYYQAHVTVAGASANDGDCWLNVDAAGQSRISDLLILHPLSSSTHADQPGIVRSARSALCNNPEAVLVPGSSLSLYAEALLPQEYSGTYEVSVTLLPIPTVVRSRKSTVEVGHPVALADSLDQPLDGGAFHSLPGPLLDSLMAATSTSAKAIEVFRKRFSAEKADNLIEVSCPLSRNLKTGDYLLTLTITDPKQRRFFLPTRRTIQIVKPGSRLFKF